MNASSKIHSQGARRPAFSLSSVATAVAMVLIATGGAVQAAETSVDAAFNGTITGTPMVNSGPGNSAPVTAGIIGATVGTTATGTPANPNPIAASTSGNLIGASATGNNFANAIQPPPAAPATPVNNAATLGVATNSGAITSGVANSKLAVELNNFQTGSVVNADNTISATTTVNNGSSLVTGTAVAGPVAPVAGSAVLTYPAGAPMFDAKGNVVVTSLQRSTGGFSSAAVFGNVVDLLLSSTLPNTVSAAASLDRNTVSATLRGNSANSTAQIQSGGAPSFTGSAVVSNLQLNAGGILAANNAGSVVAGIITGVGPGVVNQLQGSLSVQGNAISGSATGNESLGATAGTAGNRIVLGDGMSVAGSGTAATAANNSTHVGVGVVSNVRSDVAVMNSQGNIGTTILGLTTGAQVLAGAQAINKGSVTLADNSITAAGTGNTASSAIASGKGAASFAGTSALSNQQANAQSAVSATATNSVILAQTGDALGQTTASTVSVANNLSAATAQGNQITQNLALEANTVALGTSAVALTGGTSSNGRVSAAGAATVTNLQGGYDNSNVTAVNTGSQIVLNGNAPATISNSALSMTGNRQEVVALGNGATSGVTLTGNSVGTGAGIASVQMNDGTSGVGAVLVTPQARIQANANVTGGSLALSDNLQRAIAYGNAAANTVGVKSGNVSVAPGAATASTVTVDIASGLPFDNNFATQPQVNAAYGILNDQAQQATVSTTAVSVNAMQVNVGGNVTNASVGNDRNAFVAASYGNDSANGVSIAANNVAGTAPGFASVANVTNTQAVAGANTRVDATAAGGVVARTSITGGVNNSSVSSSGNMTEALAVGSRATGNTVSVKAANIDTAGIAASGALLTGNVLTTNASFSVQNAQSGQGTVAAVRSGGAEVLTQIGGNLTNAKVDADGNTTAAAATSNSANNGVSIDALGISTTTAVQNAQITNAKVTSQLGQESGGLGTKSGVQVAVGGASIQGAQVSVDGNVASGSATGNSASNGIDVKGNAIASGNGLPVAAASNVAGLAGAIADHALSNDQLVIGTAPISSKVAAAFGVDTAAGAAIGGSTLSVSGNTQSAKAVANTGSNTIALAATHVSARAAIQSAQGSLAAVESRSFTQAFAPASVTNSSVRIADNSNSALSVLNDVSNKVAIAASGTTGFAGPVLVLQGALPGNSVLTGDQLIVNRQSATTSASSTADTALYNEDRAVPFTSGVIGSSFAITGNDTLADASANRASNAVSVTGGATQGAKTAVLNAQDSSATVTASANNAGVLTLTGPIALIGSSATLSGNSTASAATGSAATNSIDIQGGTVAGGIGGSALVATGPASASVLTADHALANVQLGAAPVTASTTSKLGIDTAPFSFVAGAALSVSDNDQSARAVANTAINSVSLAGANVAARSALQSTQAGQAPVTANSTSEVFAPAASLGSTVRISGNSNAALGVINDVTNTLAVRATNTQPLGGTGAVSLSETGSADGVVAIGDHLLSNRQSAASTVSSTASTTIYNDDRAVPLTQGLVNGSLSITGNSTLAEASANRASNSASVTSDAMQGASVGIVNTQGSTAGVTATATTAAGVTLAGLSPLNGSSMAIDGNTTSALARGNAATNVLASSAGSSYGGAATVGSTSLVGGPLALNVGASAGILNSQNNAGAVSATSTGTSYQVALNAIGAPGTTNGTIGVTGNTLAAQAYGNSAVNRVTQTALNTGAPSAAIGNYQVNSGAVTAMVTSVNFGVGVTGAVGNSALRTTGNQVTASATGNSAVSTIQSR